MKICQIILKITECVSLERYKEYPPSGWLLLPTFKCAEDRVILSLNKKRGYSNAQLATHVPSKKQMHPLLFNLAMNLPSGVTAKEIPTFHLYSICCWLCATRANVLLLPDGQQISKGGKNFPRALLPSFTQHILLASFDTVL